MALYQPRMNTNMRAGTVRGAVGTRRPRSITRRRVATAHLTRTKRNVAATSLAFILPLGDDVTRKFKIPEILRPHDAATMPQMRIRFRPPDAFLSSLRGATVRGK